MIHAKPSELAGTMVRLKQSIDHPDVPGGSEFRVEDWWDRVAGKSWMVCDRNLVAMLYGIRSGCVGLPCNDEVLYGKVGCFGHLFHVSELEPLTIE